MSELLKAQLVKTDASRSKDALHGVEKSLLQQHVDRSTVGPYNGELHSPNIMAFLADPSQMVVVGCGRNEEQRGNLGPNVNYWQRATQGAGNILYVDANSTDQSLTLAHAAGVEAVRRQDVLETHVDTKGLAQVLQIPHAVIQGQELKGHPPLRKGIDVMVARIQLLREHLQGRAPTYMVFVDTDLKSIPGGEVAEKLTDPKHVYQPLELIAAGIQELSARRTDGRRQWAVYTGSENRNNEAIFAAHNILDPRSVSPFLDLEQREIAEALQHAPSTIIHPLTGELAVLTEAELSVMGATGQCVEAARTLSLAGAQYRELGTANPAILKDYVSFLGSVRRGQQQRIDEPQIDEKEWWMIAGVIPQFTDVIVEYAIRTGKVPHEFGLDDYVRINEWLAKVTTASRLNNTTQTREIDQYAMERAIPPVSLLHREGLLKI